MAPNDQAQRPPGRASTRKVNVHTFHKCRPQSWSAVRCSACYAAECEPMRARHSAHRTTSRRHRSPLPGAPIQCYDRCPAPGPVCHQACRRSISDKQPFSSAALPPGERARLRQWSAHRVQVRLAGGEEIWWALLGSGRAAIACRMESAMTVNSSRSPAFHSQFAFFPMILSIMAHHSLRIAERRGSGTFSR